jgi:hypothetical protein
MTVKLKKISEKLCDEEHVFVAEEIQFGKIDGISISYLGGAFGPTWSPNEDYDLSFLKYYNGIRALEVYLPGLTNIEPLAAHAKSLEFLRLGEFNRKTVSLNPLKELKNLSSLSLVKNKKDFEVIAELPNIRDLSLTGYQGRQVDVISSLNKLSNLYLGFGTLENLTAIEKLSGLKTLELLWVKKLSDLSAINNLNELEVLNLSTLKQVTDLPNLSLLIKLKSLILDTLNGLTSLEGLRDSSVIELGVFNSKIDPTLFSGLSRLLPKLQKLVLALDTKGTTKEALSYFHPEAVRKNINDFEFYPRRGNRIEFCT